MPATPATPIRPAQSSARRHRRTISRGSETFIAPPLDRSGSSSSLESNSSDLPLTPKQYSPPTPPPSGKRSASGAHIEIRRPPAVYDRDSSYSLPRSATSSDILKRQSQSDIAPVKEGLFNRFIRSDRRRRPSTRLEEEEEAVAANSWTAV
jgi:G1/S-specific cyclin PLC1